MRRTPGGCCYWETENSRQAVSPSNRTCQAGWGQDTLKVLLTSKICPLLTAQPSLLVWEIWNVITPQLYIFLSSQLHSHSWYTLLWVTLSNTQWKRERKKIKYLRYFSSYLNLSLPTSYFHSARGYLCLKSTCSDRSKRTFTLKTVKTYCTGSQYNLLLSENWREKMIVVVQRFDQNWSEFWLIILMIRERERERSD